MPVPHSRTGVLALVAFARSFNGENRRIPKVCWVPDLSFKNVAIDRHQQPLERQWFGFRNSRNDACSGHPGKHHGAGKFPSNLVSLNITGLKLQLLQRQTQKSFKMP